MAQRPNVLIFVPHDMGQHLGCYGAGVDTPHLDQLADEGVRLENFFCTAPQCSPSRGSVLTGQRPVTNGLIGLTHRGFHLHDEGPRLPKLLEKIGYETHLFGFQHEQPHGSESFYQHVHGGKPTCEAVTPQIVEWIEGGIDQPFYANMAFSDPHRVFTDSGDAPLDDVLPVRWLPDTPEIRRDTADLNLDVSRVDASCGAIFDALKKAGKFDDTLVIFTTDHGVAFPGAKGTLLEPGIEIAGILRGPGGFEGGQVLDQLTQNIDLLPTVGEVCGFDVPDEVEGTSLTPLLDGDPGRDEVFVELTCHAGFDPMRGVRTRTHKYIRSYERRPHWFPPNVDDGIAKRFLAQDPRFHETRPRQMLFDLEDDPLEQDNLATDAAHAETLADLSGRLDAWMAATDDPAQQGYYALDPGCEVTPPTNWNPGLDPDGGPPVKPNRRVRI